jgi:hypothetical protein
MFYLYKKTHTITGLKYLGYTKNDPHLYQGSGIVWIRHIKKHGYNVTTEVLCECVTKSEIKDKGRYYSILWNVAGSDDWANLKMEEADGGDMSHSEKWILSRKDPKLKVIWAEKAKGNTNVRGSKWWYNSTTNEKRRCVVSPGSEWVNKCPVSLTEEGRKKISLVNTKPKTQEHKDKLKIAAKNRPSNAKGTIWVKNDDGLRKRVKPKNIPEGYKKV